MVRILLIIRDWSAEKILEGLTETEDLMKKIETIFTHNEGELGIDGDLNLYWNKKKIVTQQEITLQLWINIAIIVGSFSTLVLAFFTVLRFFGYGTH